MTLFPDEGAALAAIQQQPDMVDALVVFGGDQGDGGKDEGTPATEAGGAGGGGVGGSRGRSSNNSSLSRNSRSRSDSRKPKGRTASAAAAAGGGEGGSSVWWDNTSSGSSSSSGGYSTTSSSRSSAFRVVHRHMLLYDADQGAADVQGAAATAGAAAADSRGEAPADNVMSPLLLSYSIRMNHSDVPPPELLLDMFDVSPGNMPLPGNLLW